MTVRALAHTDWRNAGAALALHAAVIIGALQWSHTRPATEPVPLIMATLLSEPATPAPRPQMSPAPAKPARLPEPPLKTVSPAHPVASQLLSTHSASATEAAPLPTSAASVPAKPDAAPVNDSRHEKHEAAKPDAAKPADASAEKTMTAIAQTPSPVVAQSSGTPGTSTAARENEMQSYLSALMRRLACFKVYPASLKKDKIEGRVVLSFTIAANGQLVISAVQKSSGHAALDQAAMEMLSRASPLPAIPAGMNRSEISLTIPVEYSLIQDR